MKNKFANVFKKIVAEFVDEDDLFDKSEELLEKKDWDGLNDLIIHNDIDDKNIVNNIIDIMMTKYRIKPLVSLIKNKKITSIDKINKIVDLAIEVGEWKPLFELLKIGSLSDAERLKAIFDGFYYNDMEQELKFLRRSVRYRELIDEVINENKEEEDEVEIKDNEDDEEKEEKEDKKVPAPDLSDLEEDEFSGSLRTQVDDAAPRSKIKKMK